MTFVRLAELLKKRCDSALLRERVARAKMEHSQRLKCEAEGRAEYCETASRWIARSNRALAKEVAESLGVVADLEGKLARMERTNRRAADEIRLLNEENVELRAQLHDIHNLEVA